MAIRGIALAFVLWGLGAAPAAAHAGLVDSDPQEGATLSALPSTITLTFNEDIASPAFVAVTAPDGSAVPTATPTVDGRTVATEVPDSGQQGDYTIAFRVVSTDGHPVEDSFDITVTEGRTVAQPAKDKESFLQRNQTYLWAGLAAMIAAAVLATRRRRHDANHT